MIHPAISREGADVRYLCPQCSGEGAFWSARDREMVECTGCEGHCTVDAARAMELHAAGRVDQRDDTSAAEYTRRLRNLDAQQFDPDADEPPTMAPGDALAALRSRLLCAEAVQADFDRRGVRQRFPVALSIEEARALARGAA